MDIDKALPFLENSPQWLRLGIVIWIAFGGLLLALVFHFYFNKDSLEKNAEVKKSIIFSHFDAAAKKGFALNCSRYRADAQLNLYTRERRICEALDELRNNMLLLAEYKKGKVTTEGDDFFTQKIDIDSTKSYINTDLTEEAYGPKKDKIINLLAEIETNLKVIKNIKSKKSLYNWSINSSMSLDDLFIGFGFLEWVIGYDSKEKVSPSEFSNFTPFFDQAFSKEQIKDVAVKKFVSPDGHIESSYSDLLSNYD